MSFMETRSAIDICNKALSLIKQQPLAGSLDDPQNLNKSAGRECKLWYNSVVRNVLQVHHWGLATKTIGMVTTTNDRGNEWAYAYAPPTDMAFPVTITPYDGVSGLSYYRGVGYLLASLYGRPLFRFSGGKLYSLVGSGVVEYVSFNITEQDFNDDVESVITLTLASILARSVAKDDKLADSLADQATQRTNTAIAHNLNMNQQRYGDRPSDAEFARAGFDGVQFGAIGPVATSSAPSAPSTPSPIIISPEDPGDLAAIVSGE